MTSTRSALLEQCWAIDWVFPERRRVVLGPEPTTVGRGGEGTAELSGGQISREHARFAVDGPIVVVDDLQSRNGTWVDGTRVQRAPVREGGVVRLGEWVGILERIAEGHEGSVEFGELGPGLFGGAALGRALEAARLAAPSELPVVIEGETGTGKERVARALHTWSKRQGDFVAVNCAALPEALAEGELFGYRRGAFTGAERANPGHFRAADRGTLLLDEFVDLSLSTQAKLLRVLEEQAVVPLGESQPQTVDVRVVVASHEPLGRAVAEQRLRPDLFARLDGLTVRLPPLRERATDVVGLFIHFLTRNRAGNPPTLEPRLVEQLCLYDWPFNVRELELMARKLLVLHGHEQTLRRCHLPRRVLEAQRKESSPPPEGSNSNGDDRDERDLEKLVEALRASAGNVARASAKAGISRQRAYRLMNRLQDLDLTALREERPR